jgi:hypothetical protein
MSNKFQFERGSAVPVIIVAIIIVILAGVGLALWNNLAPKTQSTTKSDTSNTTEPSDELVISNWGIKFTIPDNLKPTEVKYYERQSSDTPPLTYYAFTTTRIQALGGACASQPFGDTEILNRYTEKPVATPDGELLNSNAIDGYYYVLSAPPASCTVVDPNGALNQNAVESSVEASDQTALKSMIETIVASN